MLWVAFQQAAQRMFPRTKQKFHLPPPAVQLNDLEGGQIKAIGQQMKLMTSHDKMDQAIHNTAPVAAQAHDRVADDPQKAIAGWDQDGYLCQPTVGLLIQFAQQRLQRRD
jgi:hypothetical protein